MVFWRQIIYNRRMGFNHQPLQSITHELDEITALPAIARIKELLNLQDYLNARREWQHFINRLDDKQLQQAALLAHQWQWHDRVIITLGKGKFV